MSMVPLTAALVIGNRSLWEQVHACIRSLPVRIAVEQEVASDPVEPEGLLDRIERHRVDVVLLEASLVTLPLEELVRRLRGAASQPAVFIFHAEATPQLILEALRAGAAEYLYPPLTDTLRAALERLSDNRSRGGNGTSSGPGKIFGFLSVRGGCGATTFAMHVASDVARQTQRASLLADFDFEAGLLRFLMKSKSTYSVHDAIENLHRMDASYWKALVSTHANKIDLIPAPEEVAARQTPGPEQMSHLLRFIRSAYPLAIVDFGRMVSHAALDSLPELDALYLVTTFDPTSLDHAKETIAMLDERGFGHNRLKVLLNRAPEKGTPDTSGVEQFLGVPCAGVFVSDFMALYDAYSEGRLLDTSTKLGKELHALANSVKARAMGEAEQEKAPVAARSSAEGGRRWFSLFQRAHA
jgi:pilus assembly protein CpaE